jgi:hypothetical protein
MDLIISMFLMTVLGIVRLARTGRLHVTEEVIVREDGSIQMSGDRRPVGSNPGQKRERDAFTKIGKEFGLIT